MERYKKIGEWGGFLLFLFGQLMVVKSLGFYSLVAKKWLDEHRPNAILPNSSEWCFNSGLVPYIEVACVLIVVSVACKIFEKHIPMAYVLVPFGILLIFISVYIEGLGALTINWGGLLDRWK